jgi:hypothetical protein
MTRRGGDHASRLIAHLCGPAERRRPHPLREIAVILVLFMAYKAGRLAVAGDRDAATANAHTVWSLERRLHLPSEQLVQSVLLHSEVVTRLANEFYAFVHFPATAVFLLWMWLWRPSAYLGARRALAVVTALALVIHLTFPLAPPRLVPALGLVDTAALVGPAVYGDPRTDTLTNQLAAMPSLHIGWALVIAITLIRCTRSRWRWLWALHPTVTTVVVVATANHYWADGVAAAALAVGAVALVGATTDAAVARRRRPAAIEVPAPDTLAPDVVTLAGADDPVAVAIPDEP